MEDQETPAETPKKKGWPKGKPRGPRAPKPEPQPGLPMPAAPPPITEPVVVEVILKTGAAYRLGATKFDMGTSEYRFWSLPEDKRGHKTLHVVAKAEIAMISISAPEIYFEAQRVAQEAVVPAATAYPSGDPTVSIAPRHLAPNRVQGGIGPGGVPVSVGKVYDKGKEVEQVIGASMVTG